ncbi:hypothetical protein C488_16694 [Natrinema pellirubrum DSM 15624]|uniref:Uncharacterized protein n=1 Tax=Natrinema pellirubrum (strain DSM 15624 / CIP 106293 / JCM 10476 / NCIMB 786 / 157) TaxID=797303 RepID=L0JRG6_NATP1|nr:hypothetical protein [Natrinema pellirubrum]AGB33222.1 hypothetical protein Natpe_3447 [Natrinema pellirubrum DSM 15624]ELY71588.1 hypothetical protein C488_16694 [Natrinema pellirubrum DSM 15624]
MNRRRLRPLYLVGIALNAIAFSYAVTNGTWLYAGAFALVAGYLVVRLRMVSTDG